MSKTVGIQKEIELIKSKLSDWKWRLTSGKLYWIIDKSGNKIRFIPNEYQLYLINNMSYLNLILKARQLGFSTMIQILLLDQALFYSNVACGVIAQGLKEAKNIFENKIKFAYDNLPEWLKNEKPLKNSSADTLRFKHGSSIYVSVSFRGGTLQYLHISEYGKICAKNPDRAREINTGALEAVGAGCYVFIESTGEGKSGDFYDKTVKAQQLHASGKTLNVHEYKFFFFPWWQVDEYRLIDEELVLTKATKNYFKKLKEEHKIVCDEAQMKWYQVKREDKKDDMMREYPSVWQESFMIAVKGSYYGKRINIVYKENRVCRIPYEKHLPLYTAWDLGGAGGGDNMDIGFFQVYKLEFRKINWFTGSGFSIIDIHNEVLSQLPYKYDTMFLPHDANVVSMNDKKSRANQLRELGYKVVVIPIGAISDRHEQTRNNFGKRYFDSENCVDEKGRHELDMLREYQRQRNKSTGAFMNQSLKNEARHTADQFGYANQAINKFILPAMEKGNTGPVVQKHQQRYNDPKKQRHQSVIRG